MLKNFPWVWVAARKGRQVGMQLAGKAPLCRQLQCMTISQHIAAVRELTTKHAPPKMLKVDGELKLWRVDGSDWWAPPMRADFLKKMIEEIRMDVYGMGTLPKGAIVIDGGANIGMFARAALDAGAERVICFEPSPLTREALNRNLAGAPVTVRAEALWNEKGEALFAVPHGDAGSDQVVQAAGVRGTETGIRVPLVTIDEIVQELGLSRVDFIKLDIEGAETQAILGAAKTLSESHPRVAVATEHTNDVFRNNRSVLEAMSKVDGYAARCMECHAEQSETFGGLVLTPYVLQLNPPPTPAGGRSARSNARQYGH